MLDQKNDFHQPLDHTSDHELLSDLKNGDDDFYDTDDNTVSTSQLDFYKWLKNQHANNTKKLTI